MKRNWRAYLWYYAPLILWIIVIFAASSNAGSMSNTSRIIRPLLLWLIPDISAASLLFVHSFIRKMAHFIFYFILGFCAARAFLFSLNIRWRKLWFLAVFALVIIIAALDETNQSFLASRTSSVNDVLLDATGGAAALLCFYGLKQK